MLEVAGLVLKLLLAAAAEWMRKVLVHMLCDLFVGVESLLAGLETASERQARWGLGVQGLVRPRRR